MRIARDVIANFPTILLHLRILRKYFALYYVKADSVAMLVLIVTTQNGGDKILFHISAQNVWIYTEYVWFFTSKS